MRRAWLVAPLIALALGGCNLAGDVTPPPGASAPLAPPVGTAAPAAGAASPPAGSPDPRAGQSIYLERCAPCHGADGSGAGPQAADLPVAPSPLADPALAAAVTPAEWYKVVTEGRMGRFMPPFSSLSDQERWDVVGYALTLSRPPAAEGAREVYDDHCAECHGQAGAGAGTGPSLIAPATFARVSRAGIEQIIAEGAGESMPGFADDLSAEERQAVAYLVQELAQAAEVVEGEPSQQEEAETAAAALRGQIVDGADGEPIAEELEVTLHAFDGQERVLERSLTVDPGDPYSFEDLETVPGRLFMVTAEYDGVLYTSEVVHLDAQAGTRELPLTVYETTSDASQVRAARLHLLIDEPREGALPVVELWVLVNDGDRTVAAVGGRGGIEFRLPKGATNLRFEDSLLAERYQVVEGGFRLRTPLRPGGDGEQVVFSFELPANGDADLNQRVAFPVEATTVLVVEGGPSVGGEGLADRGVRQAGGEQLRQYDLGPLQAGDELALRLEGPPFWRRLLPDSLDGTWAIGVIALVAAATGIAWWYRPWISGEGEPSDRVDEVVPPPGADRRQQLFAAIAELDDAYEEGDLAEALYQRRRRQLMDQLIDLIEREDD